MTKDRDLAKKTCQYDKETVVWQRTNFGGKKAIIIGGKKAQFEQLKKIFGPFYKNLGVPLTAQSLNPWADLECKAKTVLKS